MALDMNVDVGSMIKGLFSKKDSKDGAVSAPNPHAKTALFIVAVIAVISAYIYFVYIPTQNDLRIKNEKIAQIESLRYEIEQLTSNIEQAQIDLAIAQKEYERRTTLFHTDKELEDLYGQISLLAMQNKLMITKIEKGVEKPIFSEGTCANSNMSDDQDELAIDGMSVQLQKVGYYEFVVNLEMSGNYNQFTSFRNGLAQLKKIININNESIVVPGSESKGGNVEVSSAIATYRLPKNEAEKCVDPNNLNYEEF
jgi:Tfp pilus assembly protein PilO